MFKIVRSIVFALLCLIGEWLFYGYFVEITFNGRAGACIIRPEDENIDYTYLVLPVLLQDSQY